MLPDEEKLLRLRRQRSKRAIALAMQGQWREAAAVNKDIIESFPSDVEAHNRLGGACLNLGEYSQAREAYSRALELDPYNAITKKNLQRLSYLKDAQVSSESESHKVGPQHFIKEIGRAGEVYLSDLAPKEVLARILAGDSVNIKIDAPNLIVENMRGEYLGRVDPRHAQRIIKLIEGGNKYTAAVVSSTEDRLLIIIREVYQDPSQAGRISFPPRGLEEARPFVSDRIFKLKAEYDEEEGESGYTIIGGREVEVLPQEPVDVDDDAVSNEE